MRKVVVSEFISMDGVIENPMFTMPFGSPEQERFKFAELKAADALLLGRVTYDGFAAAWPNMVEQTGEYGEMMNGYPKYVASTTLKTVEWNNSTILEGGLAGAVGALKAQEGRDIVVFGSGKLIESLWRENLIDEYRLMVFPVVLGEGQRLFTEKLDPAFELVETKPFASGVVVFTYRPKAAGGAS